MSLARLISLVEAGNEKVIQVLKAQGGKTGSAFRLGITGPPGVGKSTITDKLITVFRKNGYNLGMICVDPSSPFSGGAFLGDRIRMNQHVCDDGVFIRSMATRGNPGGLPSTLNNVVKLLDAYGMDIILIETTGVGQTELDIMQSADVMLVVLVPEAGDIIQAMKAGMLEIADILIVNKADIPGADKMVVDLQDAINLRTDNFSNYHKQVLTTTALTGEGIDHLYEQTVNFRQMLISNGMLDKRRREQRRTEFVEAFKIAFMSKVMGLIDTSDLLEDYFKKIDQSEVDPACAALELSQSLIKKDLGKHLFKK